MGLVPLFIQHFFVFPRADADVLFEQLGKVAKVGDSDGVGHVCNSHICHIKIAQGCLNPGLVDVLGQCIPHFFFECIGQVGQTLLQAPTEKALWQGADQCS